MRLKATLFTILATLTCLANGLYFISGGDFRPCSIKYIVETTTPNQEVEVSPYSCSSLAQWQSETSKWVAPWSIKYDNKEHEFGMKEVLRGGDGKTGSQVNSCVNAMPVTNSFKTTGKHMVKMYDSAANIYSIVFRNEYMTSLYVDWENLQSTFEGFVNGYVQVNNCPNLTYLYMAHPLNRIDNKGYPLNGFYNLSQLKTFILKNPEKYTYIVGDTIKNTSITNDMYFLNVTNVGGAAFSYSPNIQYIGFPNVVSMGKMVCWVDALPNSPEYGIKVLQIGDTLRDLPQESTCKPFYRQEKIHTIEFVTDETDWISTWNNHSILPNLFGTANGDSSLSEATLTPMPQPSVYYGTGTAYPKPTRIVLVRRSELQ